MSRPTIAKYTFNPSTGRYRDLATGRFVKNEYILSLVESTIRDSFVDLNILVTTALDANTPFDINDLQRSLMNELRNLHVQMTLLGGGGRDNITPSQWGKLGATLKAEYQYLQGFMQDIADGKLSPKQIEARMNMYGNKIWNSYWQAKGTQMQNTNRTQERRLLSPVENCEDCIALADRGWQPIGTLPKPADGSTVCLSNCRCVMEYK